MHMIAGGYINIHRLFAALCPDKLPDPGSVFFVLRVDEESKEIENHIVRNWHDFWFDPLHHHQT